ncbi:putative nuclease HARBI1 [Dermacentor albipictus]|uniref:putative nuclease HARBI1 n=1 Tax=Dermacentor albipictus TaxID=60249 RepID=UPI0038FCBEA0
MALKVCDGDMKILDIDPRFPGSCQDSFVWRHTPLRSRLETVLRPGEIVLGDSGYPLEPLILTPVPGIQATDTPEGRYKRAHTSMRNVVGRCIGLLKSRFRCLQRYPTLLHSPEKAAVLVATCAALHNIALEAGEPCVVDDDDDKDDDDVLQVLLQPHQSTSGELPSESRRPPQPHDLLLRGRLQRNLVVNLFRGRQAPYTAYLQMVRRRLRQSSGHY